MDSSKECIGDQIQLVLQHFGVENHNLRPAQVVGNRCRGGKAED